MKQFNVFLHKEITENLRTYKSQILIAVFLLLGIISPLLAKLLPEIIGSIGLDGLAIALPEPTALDAWTQFFHNVSQMGLLCMVILFSGLMANELAHGTLINLLAKGLSRTTVILAKFASASLQWTLAYLLCLGTCALYTAFYWSASLHHGWLVFGGLWLFGELLIALMIFGGTLSSSFYGSLSLCAGAIILFTLLSLFPDAVSLNPLSLTSSTQALLTNSQSITYYLPAYGITAVLIASFLLGSIWLFKKKPL